MSGRRLIPPLPSTLSNSAAHHTDHSLAGSAQTAMMARLVCVVQGRLRREVPLDLTIECFYSGAEQPTCMGNVRKPRGFAQS